MKNFYLLLICCIFATVILFPGNYARCQTDSQVNYTAGDSPPEPQLYTSDQNNGDVKTHFSGVTAVGNILYIPMIKTIMPPDFTPPYSSYQPMDFDSQYVLRAIDFSNPDEPIVINDMEMGLDFESGPLNHLIISGEHLYMLRNEDMLSNASLDPSGYYSPNFEEVNFSIYKIQDNKNLIITKSMSLNDILHSVKVDENEIFYPQLLKLADNCAYLIFHGISFSEPPANQYPSEADAFYPLPQPENNTVEVNDTVIDPYSSSPSENNTVIVTVDIKDPYSPRILGATRLQIACFRENMDLFVKDHIGYLLVPSIADSDSNIHVLDLSSPNDILEINSLDTYGKGGQLVREGDNLYMASQGFGLQIFDISTPTAPKLISLIETPYPLSGSSGGGLGVENKIIVKDGYVYMLNGKNGLLVLDVSDSNNPNIVSSYLSGYLCYLLGYISRSSPSWWYSAYTSVTICGDYLFLAEISSGDIGSPLNIISIADPLSPVSVGILGERLPVMLTIALRLEVAELLNIHPEQGLEGDIALFGIPSLDDLNRKYGVLKIEQTSRYSQYGPGYPSSIEDSEHSAEDIKKDRNLRTFYLTFPGSVDFDEIVADYQKNPYVITAETGIQEIYRDSGPYEGPYYPVQEPEPVPYGGVYGASLYGSGKISGYSGYGGLGTPLGLATTYPVSTIYPDSYPGPGPGVYGGYGSSGSYSGQMPPISASTPMPGPTYPVSTIYPGTYSGPGPGAFGGYGFLGSYGRLMPPLPVSTPVPEPTVHIGAINIEGGVHIGALTINSEPSSTAPGLSIMLIPDTLFADTDSLRDSATYSSDDTPSSDGVGLPGSEYLLNDSSNSQLNTNWSNPIPWIGNQEKSSSGPFTTDFWLW